MTDRHSENARDYEVGYGKPPKEHQFKKGQSGNRRGRPKGRKNVATFVNEILTTPTTISLNGKKQEIPAFAGAILAQLQKALAGDSRAASKIIEWVEKHAPEVLKEEVNAEVERRLAEHRKAIEDADRELRDRMSMDQKRRYLKCIEEIRAIYKECGLDEDS